MGHNWFGECFFYDAEHHHRGQAHKHVRKARQDDRRRTNSTHRVGALPQSHPGLVGPRKDTHGTPVPLRRKAVGNQLHTTTPKRQDQGLQRHALVPNSFHQDFHNHRHKIMVFIRRFIIKSWFSFIISKCTVRERKTTTPRTVGTTERTEVITQITSTRGPHAGAGSSKVPAFVPDTRLESGRTLQDDVFDLFARND